MVFLNFLLLQLDEACHHIADGRMAQLRIALLLLDNAAEIQMQRCAEDQLLNELRQERMKKLTMQYPLDVESEYIQGLAKWEPLTYNEKLNISRNYDAKVKYLSERVGQLDSRVAGPLICLHRYRNEAYHCGRIRKDTIDTTARLLLEINCILLQSLPNSSRCYASDEDYSWLRDRFGLPSTSFLIMDEDLISKAVQEFRNIIVHNDETVRTLLFDHLLSRIHQAEDALKFVVENTGYTDYETAIRDSYELHMELCKQEGRSTTLLSKSAARHSMTYLSGLKDRIKSILKGADHLDSFHRFSVFESEFEPVEQSVSELETKIDEMIQLQVDIARGK